MQYERRTKGETALFALGTTLAVMTFGWVLRRLGRWLDSPPARPQYREAHPYQPHGTASYLPTVHSPTAHRSQDHRPGKVITQPEYAQRHEQKPRSTER